MTEKELAQTCANAVNVMGFKADKFCDEMLNEHRTLQQNFTRLCFEWIKACSESRFDARNEASVKACKELQKVIEEKELYLPYI